MKQLRLLRPATYHCLCLPLRLLHFRASPSDVPHRCRRSAALRAADSFHDLLILVLPLICYSANYSTVVLPLDTSFYAVTCCSGGYHAHVITQLLHSLLGRLTNSKAGTAPDSAFALSVSPSTTTTPSASVAVAVAVAAVAVADAVAVRCTCYGTLRQAPHETAPTACALSRTNTGPRLAM